jgi:PPOX class probable F420-dependent enzyme
MSLWHEHLSFIFVRRVGRLATADRAGQPHVIPVCYACDETHFYIALDSKPKRVAPQQLKRIRNIQENPPVALVIDCYSEDWNEIGYVLLRGSATLIAPGQDAYTRAVTLLRERYPQYRAMPIHEQPVVALRPESVVAWGNLE